jgi:hypothetical protein
MGSSFLCLVEKMSMKVPLLFVLRKNSFEERKQKKNTTKLLAKQEEVTRYRNLTKADFNTCLYTLYAYH